MVGPGRSRITPDVVQAVRDAVDIVDIAGDLTQLKRRGKKYLGLCPFHKEKSPSFNVDSDQGLFYCFGCGVGGDAIKLFQQGSGDDFPAAIEALALRYGIALPEVSGSYSQEPVRNLTSVLEEAQTFFRQRLAQSPSSRQYLENRQIPRELSDLYALGYAPDDWRQLLETLRPRFPLDDLIDSGLVGRSQRTNDPYDRFRHRLMFPIHSISGRLVGFGGRTLGDDKAKYVNTPETEQFHKGRLLYGFYQAKRALRDESKALLVEGYFDVLGAAASGIPWAVAAMGTSLTAEQARLLSRYVDEVIVAYDGDEAGEKAFRRALPILLAAGLGVRRAQFPTGHDPDSLRLEKGPEAVQGAVTSAEDGLTLEIDRLTPVGLDDPFEKSRAASTIAELLAPIRDAVVRESYGKIAAERLGIRPEVLRRRGRSRTDSPPPEISAQNPPKPGDVRTEEEKALVLLLRSEGPLPPFEQLPSEKVFFDPVCRNIYRSFCALIEGDSARPPTGKEVIERMSSESSDLGSPDEGGGIEITNGLIDRAARLLLEEPNSAGGDLQATFDLLLHRWHKTRQSELKTEILRAERENDQPRLARLLEEKKLLSRSLHPRMTGRLW